ncbi:hypothetical protein F0562_010935 [Nyssa sinensis]|uniref:Integrase catalytic domain-containing protein n=1 Tax=Nyssa sinensis TaxID=561372 RepID=A0A5J5A3X4_9ASTE|nr:hypothetical protein F0562_010935 [Nyssa sinensis]
MIEAKEEEDVFEDVVQEMEKENVQEELQISVHALSGSLSYKTMRIKGKVKKNMVIILIDSGSTHNFLDPVMAKRTGASIQFTNPLAVVVADATKLQSKAMVKDFQWVMQGITFTTDMRLLPLGGCDMRNKYETVATPRLLQPLPIPTKLWTDISMDFIEGLLSSSHKTVIYVVVDMLSKYGHFIPLTHSYTATVVAQAFLDNVFKLHGMSFSIVSDRDPVFTSNF